MNKEQLYAYLDGELAPEEAARVEGALARDPALAAELQAMRGIDSVLATLPGHDAPADFTDRVLAARRRGRGLVMRLALPLAAAAALALAVFVPRGDTTLAVGDEFTQEEYLNYVWEADEETFGSMALDELEQQILEGLDST